MDEFKNIPVFIYPTDTVWGIGTNASLEFGSDYIADIKNTKRGKPLSVLFSELDLLFEYFDIPEQLDRDWLRNFFKFESTLGLPVSWSNGKIAESVFAKMPHVCVRVIETREIEILIEKACGPVLSTSVNLTGEAPANSEAAAQEFLTRYVPEATLISLEELKPSGHSSTIVLLNDDFSWNLIREGENVGHVKKVLKLLTT